jgi:phosphate transport system permease protein
MTATGQSRKASRTAIYLSRRSRDRLAEATFFLVTVLPIAILLAVIVALAVRSWPIIKANSIGSLLGGRVWKPQQGLFGFYPFIVGTFWVTVLSLILAVPPSLLTAIYLAEYSRPRIAAITKPLLDLLAGIPSVVYGVWGIVVIVPWVQSLHPFFSRYLGFIPLFQSDNPTGFSILSGSLVLALMIVPFIIAVTYEVLRTVPEGPRHASLAVGATRWQTIRHAVLPQSTPGIIAGVILGASRALGETMAVLMVVGNIPLVPNSIFDPAYPLPALIANNYGEMMSIPMYDWALLGAALVLLLIVLAFNLLSTMILRQIVRRMPR